MVTEQSESGLRMQSMHRTIWKLLGSRKHVLHLVAILPFVKDTHSIVPMMQRKKLLPLLQQVTIAKDGLSDLLSIADIVVDCSPGKVGAQNKEIYQNAGVKWIFQGGEKHAMTEMSYTSSGNHAENMNVQGTRSSRATQRGCQGHLFHFSTHAVHCQSSAP